jgi:hypothetical protein
MIQWFLFLIVQLHFNDAQKWMRALALPKQEIMHWDFVVKKKIICFDNLID